MSRQLSELDGNIFLETATSPPQKILHKLASLFRERNGCLSFNAAELTVSCTSLCPQIQLATVSNSCRRLYLHGHSLTCGILIQLNMLNLRQSLCLNFALAISAVWIVHGK
jgi:hypothetical protein